MFGQGEPTRLNQLDESVARWRCAVDPEAERFASGSGRGSGKTPVQPRASERLDGEVVEHQHATLCRAGDFAQRALDRRAVQIHDHALPQEYCGMVRSETGLDQAGKPVLGFEVSGHEGDDGRVDPRLVQQLTFAGLRLRQIHLCQSLRQG